MKKTKFMVITNYSVTTQTLKRVYEDEAGKRYIKKNGEYVCIENTPCIDMMIED